MPNPTFASLGIPEVLERSLRARRLREPFPIQTEAIPPALAGRDVLGRAPTGSGKTLAFGIPMVSRCPVADPQHPTGLVLAPTRELADQVADELTLLAEPIGLVVERVYGGVSLHRQAEALEAGVDIVVACPGRLADLIERGALSLDSVEILVIDEADRMADMGFLPDVCALIDQTPPDRQTLLFSATLDGDVDTLVERYLSDPLAVHATEQTSEEATPSEVFFWTVPRNKRLDVTAQIAAALGSTIVFCRTRHGADRVCDQLIARGLSAVALHGDKRQSERHEALEAFRDGAVKTLVATDVAARGLHIESVDGVIHFDTPADDKDFIHRSGRTGRAGATGTVVMLIIPEAMPTAERLRRELGGRYAIEPADPGRLARRTR
ncbi:MAG: DEAD/DEAH box helicase [Actinobacteria bacterium]|nr:DEAD/DEAH box helicase [Actinomycetota bacterium]